MMQLNHTKMYVQNDTFCHCLAQVQTGETIFANLSQENSEIYQFKPQ